MDGSEHPDEEEAVAGSLENEEALPEQPLG